MNKIKFPKYQITRKKRNAILLPLLFVAAIFSLISFTDTFSGTNKAEAAAGDLVVTIATAHNLVVDSNVKSPSTYAPRVATVMGTFCNQSATTTLTDVQGFIGDHTGSGAGTPGNDPDRDSAVAPFTTDHPDLANSGIYEFIHVGGSTGNADAARFIGDLAPGDCANQYWHFTYPACENTGSGPWQSEEPPCSLDPVWGSSVKPIDDLWLEFDIWGTAFDGTSTIFGAATRKMTMRNEISANANKIRPNPDGRWFNTDTDVILPGDTITTNGILYALGNINKGFDNDVPPDLLPDYNAWLQPIGEASYDPSCFRLIKSTGVLTVSRSAQPDLIMNFEDKLYFQNLPNNNTGVRGEVFYTFLALSGPCSIPVSPYQEVASGFDNEKFNGDYGTGIPPVSSSVPKVTVGKNGPTTQGENTTFTYNLPFANTDATKTAGLTLSSGGAANVPLVVRDAVPSGLEYVCGSAAASNTLNYTPAVAPGYGIRYSTDSGLTWSVNEPGSCPGTNPTSTGPNNLIVIEWWLTEPLPTSTNNGSGTYTFQATIPATYISGGGAPLIENCAEGNFGGGAKFAETCHPTLVTGTASIGDRVWQDDDGNGIQDAAETTNIPNITVSLYYDKNGNGTYEAGTDPLISTDLTDATSANYDFLNLPAGKFLVIVDYLDSDLPTGYTPTTPKIVAVTLTAGQDYNDADFGFGPTLDITKALRSTDPAYVGEEVTYTFDVENNLPGDGTSSGFCKYTIWASIVHPDNTFPAPTGGGTNKQWGDPSNVTGSPDFQYAFTDMSNAGDVIGFSGFNLGNSGGAITDVDLLLYMTEDEDLDSSANITFNVFHSDASIGSFVFDAVDASDPFFNATAGDEVILMQDVDDTLRTGLWTWADFANNLTELQGSTSGGNAAGGNLKLDAAAYVITTDQTDCGGPDTTIGLLPVQDTYDSTYLQFVSSEPTASNVTPGTIDWDNLGPLYAGQTKRITVTFKALLPVASTINTASVTAAKFSNGLDVNNASDTATVGINNSGSIAGTVWANTNNNGWQGTSPTGTGYDGGDTFIPNVTVELYGCFLVINGAQGPLLTPATAGSTNKECTNNANDGAWYLITTETTDASGAYLFDGLRDGYYNVKVNPSTLPAGFTTNSAETNPTGTGSGTGCPTCNNDWNTQTANLNTFNDLNSSSASENVPTVSFGYVSPTGGGVVGYVWNDRNGDGVWDMATEEPIPNATVNLCGVLPCNDIQTTTTDANGFYDFAETTLGVNRYVEVITPSGMTQSGDPDFSGVDCRPSNCDGVTTTTFQISADELEGPYNFGYTGGLSIGDTIYTDWNGDGTQDTGEEGINGVDVALYRDVDGDGVIDPEDTLVDTQTTNSSGNYTFSNLAGGGNKYIVKVIESSLPTTYTYAQTGDPSVGQAGSTCTVCDAKSSVTLTTSNVTDQDFGYQPQGLGSIGDYIWADTDGDGIQDAGESGVNGVTVNIYQDDGTVGTLEGNDALVATVVTAGGGLYSFGNLPPGNYIVEVASSNFTSGQPLEGLTHTNDTQNNLHTKNLGNGESYTAADFGYASSTIGDYVWADANGNGSQDVGEPGISGVTVQLYNWNDADTDGEVDAGEVGSLISSTPTNGSGFYEFTGLTAGDYVVRIDQTTLPAGATLTYDFDAYSTNPGKQNSPCDPGDVDYQFCDHQSGVSLAIGQTDRSLDFGYKLPNSIGDTVWFDVNQNGIKEAGEGGIPFITVELLDGICTIGSCPTTETDVDGQYLFTNLNPGTTYTVVVHDGNGANPLDPDFPAVTQTYDPDQPATLPCTICDGRGSTTLAVGADDFTRDFGYAYIGAATLGGDVFFDVNQSGGVFEGSPTDNPFQGITVYLLNTSGQVLDSTQTDAAGAYSFANLAAGNYQIAVDLSTSPILKFMTQYFEPDEVGDDNNCTTGVQNCNNNTTVNTADGDANNQDFGFYANMDCGDLPSTFNYRTPLNLEGPCHIRSNPADPNLDPNPVDHQLGANWDSEVDGQNAPLNDASDDDTAGIDDEDGIIRSTGQWIAGNTVTINAHVVGDNAYLAAWIDWNQDGDFINGTSGYDANEYYYFGLLAPGVNALNIVVPVTVPPCCANVTDLHSRWRLYQGSSPPAVISPGGTVIDGEVEDYKWSFSPTAITLNSIQASAPSSAPMVLAGGLVLLASLGILTGLSLRRRTAVRVKKKD